MAVQLILPSFRTEPLENLVTGKNGEPLFTQISHGLQAANQYTLWELVLRSGVQLPRGAILDAGCGDGLFIALAPSMIFSVPEIGRRTIIGVDKEPKKVTRARDVADSLVRTYAEKTRDKHPPNGLSLNIVVQDPQDLVGLNTREMIVNGEMVQFPSVAMVWNNSVFHWIREPEKKIEAIDGFNSILAQGGVLAMSVSAGGTARDFLQAYNNVLLFAKGPYDRNSNPMGYRTINYKADPIGSRPLDELVNMIEEGGFSVRLALTLGESITYTDPLAYSAAVKIYGENSFLSPVSHYGERARRTLWDEVEREFLSIVTRRGWAEGKPWVYTQYNNYIIAVKTGSSTPDDKSIKLYEPASVLNQRFLYLCYRRMLEGRNMGIDVDGAEEQLRGIHLSVNLAEILSPLIKHAVEVCKPDEKSPVCRIGYQVEDNLMLTVDVSGRYESNPERLFKKSELNRLSESGVSISFRNVAPGIGRYEFSIPLV